MAKQIEDREDGDHEGRISDNSRAIRDLMRIWSEEKENIYGAISKLSGEVRAEFKQISAEVSRIGKPNWQVIAIVFAMMIAGCSLLMFAVQSTVAPFDQRLKNIEQEQRDQVRLVEIAIRNDERWNMYLSGHLAVKPATKPAN